MIYILWEEYWREIIGLVEYEERINLYRLVTTEDRNDDKHNNVIVIRYNEEWRKKYDNSIV